MLLVGVILLLGTGMYGQKWIEMMQDPEAKFSETVLEFEKWWNNRDVSNTKGTGFKQFQRWRYYMESRITADGKQSGPLGNYEAIEEYYRNKNQGGRSVSSATADWQEVGPVYLPLNGTGQPNGVGRVTAIAFHPTDPNIIYVGSPAGGFLQSDDYGSTWVNKSNALSRLGISSIVIHPSNPDIIYIGTGDRDGGDAPGRGVWRSTNGGQSWQQWNSGMGNRTVYEILMHPSNPDIMIASTNSKIYKTINGGQSWTQVHSSGNNKDIAFHPGNPNIVYASGKEFYRSDDNGDSWTQITSILPGNTQRIAIAITEAAPDIVYLFYGNSSGFQGLYRSTDAGLNFTLQSNSPNICGYDTNGGTGSQAWYDLVAIGDETDPDHIIIGAINLWESFDGGQNWSIMSHWVGYGHPSVHADQHVLEWNPHTGNLFAGHDGGIHFSADTSTFTEISSGLGISQIYKIGQSATEGGVTIAGFQDNGTALIDNGVWRTEIGGDGMECIVDYTSADVMYGALYYGDIRRSTNRGYSFSTIAKESFNGITERGGWVTPYKLNPINPDTMYIGYKNVWRAFDCKSAISSAVSWVKISSFSGSSNIVDLGISKSDPDQLYVSRSGSQKFLRSDDVNAPSPTWTDLTSNLPANSTPKDIEVHPTDPNTVWISIGNDIYKSTDAGMNWTNISGTLPNLSLNTILAIPNHPEEALYVGMDVGVYYLDNTLSDWEDYGQNIPNTEVLELEVYFDEDCPGDGKLIAATYGRGMWETPLYDAGNLAPVVCFEASAIEGCVGASIVFTDKSAYGPTSWIWEVTPGTHAYVMGTNSNSQNPVIRFDALGQYTVTLTASNGNGTDQLVMTDYIDINEASISLPFYEDFESMSTCSTASNCGGTVCTLNNGWTNASNGTEDVMDWRVDSGGTPSNGTGPNQDFNPGTGSGKYIYTEASSCFNQDAELISPCINLMGVSNPSLTFAYHMNGTDMGSLHIDILVDGIWQEDIIDPISGNQGSNWLQKTIPLTSFVDKLITLKFRGVTGPSYRSDIAIDDISIVDLGACTVSNTLDSGPGSLRSCIDNGSDGMTINFDPSIQNTEIELIGGPLIVNHDLDIMALEVNNIGISALNMDRAMDISNGKTVHIKGVIIRAGTATLGRGIRNLGILTLEDVDVFDNNAMAGTGSLIDNQGEIFIMGNCNIMVVDEE